MRAFRVFNNVDRIPVEWTILGQRYLLPSMGLMVAGLALGVAISFVATPWVGAPVAGVNAAVVVFVNWRLNQMDPEGVLGEMTRLAMLWRTTRHPYITNTGGRPERRSYVTNTGRR